MRHGTAYCYDQGCRRAECRAAKMSSRRASRARTRAANTPGYQHELATSQARKESYRGVCEECGAPTTGCDGPGRARRFCKLCAPAAYARRTPEAVISAIRAWAERFGAPPTATQWNTTLARRYLELHPASVTAKRNAELAQIVLAEDWPRAATVQWRFGSFSAGLRAAGFEPTKPGRKTGVAA